MMRKKNHQSFKGHYLQFSLYGRYFGYPRCCVEDFIERGFSPKTDEQLQVHKNHGFIPCPKCSKKVLNGETTLEGLLEDRICPEPFPGEGNSYEIDEVLEEIKNHIGITLL